MGPAFRAIACSPISRSGSSRRSLGQSCWLAGGDRAASRRHPLAVAKPVVFGRCLACDDVVVRLMHPADGPELAVVHLTWSGRAEKVTTEGTAWFHFERLTFDNFVARFVHGGEHA